MSENVDSTALPAGTDEERIVKALSIAVAYGGIDGAHHKDWTIDQMVRALTGCPVVVETVETLSGPVGCLVQGESDEYKELIAEACDGSDGPETYFWETGIAP